MAAVLIVEPASPERDRLVELLEGAGHRCTLADDPARAGDRYDLAVVDEAIGLEAVKRLKADAQGFVPVVLVLDHPSAEARVAALAVADDAVSRPFDPGELAARCLVLLRTRRVVDEHKAARAESEARALADAATGLRNRIFLGERLDEEWKRAARFNAPLSLILLSVDGLRAHVEARGTAVGDRVLRAVAAAAHRSLRQIDIITRFGPTELAALLPNTHVAGSLICAERLWRDVSRTTIEELTASLSLGIAFFPSREATEPAELVRLAARALERARQEGPGSICLVQHQGYLFQPKKA